MLLTAWRITVVRFANCLTRVLFLVPVICLTASWFSSCCLHLNVCAKFLYVMCTIVLEFLIVFLLIFVPGSLLERIEE